MSANSREARNDGHPHIPLFLGEDRSPRQSERAHTRTGLRVGQLGMHLRAVHFLCVAGRGWSILIRRGRHDTAPDGQGKQTQTASRRIESRQPEAEQRLQRADNRQHKPRQPTAPPGFTPPNSGSRSHSAQAAVQKSHSATAEVQNSQ